jgi:hypothetical protein
MQQINDMVFGLERKQFMFYTAKDFLDRGVERLKEVHVLDFSKFHSDDTWNLCFPLTNISFALELAIKGFLPYSKKEYRHHLLLDLYKGIDSNIRNEIEKHFESCGAYDYNFPNLVFGKEGTFPDISSIRNKILDALKKCNKPFEQFRYLFEYTIDKGNYYFYCNTLIKLTHSCLAVQAEKLSIKPQPFHPANSSD